MTKWEKLNSDLADAHHYADDMKEDMQKLQLRIVQHWKAGYCTEGTAAALLGVDRLTARKIAIELGCPIYGDEEPEEFDKFKEDLFHSWEDALGEDGARLRELTDIVVDTYYESEQLRRDGVAAKGMAEMYLRQRDELMAELKAFPMFEAEKLFKSAPASGYSAINEWVKRLHNYPELRNNQE